MKKTTRRRNARGIGGVLIECNLGLEELCATARILVLQLPQSRRHKLDVAAFETQQATLNLNLAQKKPHQIQLVGRQQRVPSGHRS